MYKNLIKEIESASEPGNEEGLRRFDLITNEIGWTINNRQYAEDLLSFYPQCDYKELKKVYFSKKGILFTRLIF